MKLLTCYVATTQEEKRKVLQICKPQPYVILSDITFSSTEPIVLLSEVDRKRPREVKSRLYQYLSLSNYDYLLSLTPNNITIGNPQIIATGLQDTIGLFETMEPLRNYSAFLTPDERRKNHNLYSAEAVFIPTNNDGLLFMDFWNRYTCRLKERENLAITLVVLRHFRSLTTIINNA